METEETDGPPYQLPERIFACGEEPTGVRVTPYHKASGIRLILNALDVDEVQMIQESPFGKLVEIADKPAFSGRFGRYIISRQLKVAKKHEAWFLFAGKPIRFSLREFALVTGLSCKKFPKHSKKRAKNFITEKPYWGELFGTLKEVPVSCVVRMLKKKPVVDKDDTDKIRILPTTHTPRISQDHAELIKDLDAFFRIHGGGIKERKEVSLSQNTIALKGFVLSLQLVMVEAVPALTEAVGDGSSSGSEGDSGEEDDNIDGDKSGKQSISPGHARDTDAAGKAAVQSIILDGNSEITTSPDFEWSDDEDDVMVDNMVNLIVEDYAFKPSSFMGGASRVDVCRMREEAKTELQNRKTVKTKVASSAQGLDVLDADSLASIVRDITDCTQSVSNIDGTTIRANVGLVDGEYTSAEHDDDHDPLVMETDADGTLDPALLFRNPSFSLGVTQEERLAAERDANLPVHPGQESADEDQILGEMGEAVMGCRKSKRQKLPTKSLLGQYECDRLFVNRARQAVVDSHNASGNIDYSAKYSVLLDKMQRKFNPTFSKGWLLAGSYSLQLTIIFLNLFTYNIDMISHLCIQVVDVLIFHIASFFQSLPRANQKSPDVFLDTQFVSQFTKLYTKFSKVSRKESFKFPSNLIEQIQNNPAHTAAERFYFPFNMDQKYWVGIIIDCSSWTVTVLDCNNVLRSDYMMRKEIRPIAQMFPYLLKQVGKVVAPREGKAMNIDRPRSIPQHNAVTDSAVVFGLFIQAHAVAGVDGCKCITPDVLDSEVERLLVTLYEATIGPL
ncbi:hypothetical protein N665_1041s0007 [Sinapis alba]|nr:hypothetical protein N665_1041s0007 [Sinapis alba]